MPINRLESRRLTAQHSDRDSEALAAHNQNEWTGRMYAIAFDLDTVALERAYPTPHWRNAYDDIARELRAHGFERQQGSVYFGTRGMTSVHCVLAAQALSKRYPWFNSVVRDMRMLRIEENNDLMPAIGQLDLPLAPRKVSGD